LVERHQKWDEPLTNEANSSFFFFFFPSLSLSSRAQQLLETGRSSWRRPAGLGLNSGVTSSPAWRGRTAEGGPGTRPCWRWTWSLLLPHCRRRSSTVPRKSSRASQEGPPPSVEKVGYGVKESRANILPLSRLPSKQHRSQVHPILPLEIPLSKHTVTNCNLGSLIYFSGLS
jgi:hypothetical protein